VIPTEKATVYANSSILTLADSPIKMNQTITIDPTLPENYKFTVETDGSLTLTMVSKDVNGSPSGTEDSWKVVGQRFVVNAYNATNVLLESSLFDIPTSMKPLVPFN
ncbi:MAG: hypothetical protein RSD69_02095, partial [Bacilli bacterium]